MSCKGIWNSISCSLICFSNFQWTIIRIFFSCQWFSPVQVLQFLSPIKLPGYNWNIVESGIKHHDPNSRYYWNSKRKTKNWNHHSTNYFKTHPWTIPFIWPSIDRLIYFCFYRNFTFSYSNNLYYKFPYFVGQECLQNEFKMIFV